VKAKNEVSFRIVIDIKRWWRGERREEKER